MKKIMLGLVMLFHLTTIFADGYQLNVQSQKNVAMGHTGVGYLLDASSVHFNPGALAFLTTKYNFSGGCSLTFSDVRFSKLNSNYRASTNNSVGTPLYFYGAGRLNDKMVISLGVTTPYGNSLKWDKDWDGRYLIQDISLRAIAIQPTFSYQINDKLGIGVGVMITNGSVDLNKALPLESETGDGSVNLSGTTTAIGFNAGLFYQMNSKISVGVNYRSEMDMKIDDGNVNFNVPASMSSYFPNDNSFKAELPLPANLTVGVAYKLKSKWLFAVDIQHVYWSAYEELNFNFKNNTSLLADSSNPRNYKNTSIYRVGGQYKASELLTIRAGAYYDESPILDDYMTPETPGMDKIGVSCGASVNIGERLSVDASLLYIKGLKRDSGYKPAAFYGTYDSVAILPGVGLSYAF